MNDEQYQTALLEQKCRVAGHFARWMFNVRLCRPNHSDLRAVGGRFPQLSTMTGWCSCGCCQSAHEPVHLCCRHDVSACQSYGDALCVTILRTCFCYVCQCSISMDGYWSLTFCVVSAWHKNNNNDQHNYASVYESGASHTMTELR